MRPIACMAAIAIFSGCGQRQAPIVMPRILAGTEPCRADVKLKIEQNGVILPAGAVRVLSSGPGLRGGSSSGTELQPVWEDSIYTIGSDTVRGGTSIFVWSVETRGRSYDIARSLHVRCGQQRAEVIAIPSVKTVYVSSDPAEASIFVRFRTGSYSSEERFVATTPTRLELEWQPGQHFMHIRVEKSGYQGVRQEIKRSDSNVRVILQPLPLH